MTESSFYDYDYYEQGKCIGISNYVNYRWLPCRSHNEVKSFVEFSGIHKADRILDFGCAKGYLVKAFNIQGYKAFGCDISKYAIENTDRSVRAQCKIMNSQGQVPFNEKFAMATCIHVLEHIDAEQIPFYLQELQSKCQKILVRVPLGIGGMYVNPKHSLDVSHVIAEDEHWWASLFYNSGFRIVKARYSFYSSSKVKDQADFLITSNQPRMFRPQTFLNRNSKIFSHYPMHNFKSSRLIEELMQYYYQLFDSKNYRIDKWLFPLV